MIPEFTCFRTLRQSLELLEHYKDAKSSRIIETSLPATLPAEGLGSEQTLELLAPLVLGNARDLADPGFFAHMDPPVPAIAVSAALWNAAMNQNVLHIDTAPAARDIEERVIEWLKPFFGMNCGHMVPGSTVANIEALWVARQSKGIKEVVASRAAHLSVSKAAALLGLEFRAVETDARQRLRPECLGDLRNAALVLTAGTTSAGAIDPLDAGANAAWRHVDAAWAGPLRLSPASSNLLSGIETADSVAVSAHKWLFQPKDSALVLFADPRALDCISFGGSYLKVPNVGILGSSSARGVPLLATLLAFGQQGIAQLIEHCLALVDELAVLVSESSNFEIFDRPQSGCLLWRSKRISADELAASMHGAFVSTTLIDGTLWLRSVGANPFAEPRRVFEAALNAESEALDKLGGPSTGSG